MSNTLNVDVNDLASGKLVDFKRKPGRGRPSLGKVISAGPRVTRVENILGQMERVPTANILQIRTSRPTRRTKAEMQKLIEITA